MLAGVPDAETEGWKLSTWLRATTQTSRVLQTAVVDALKRWCCTLASFQTALAASLVTSPDRVMDPMMHCFQSDGFSALVVEDLQGAGGDRRLRRKGCVKKEFLCERSLIKTIDIHDQITGKLVMSPGRSLDKGCSNWHIWHSSLQHFPLLRDLGCKGPVLHVSLQDGLHHVLFSKHMEAYHSLYYASNRDTGDDDDDFLQENTDWCFRWKCTGHVGSNGLKWGHRRFSSEALLKQVHVAIRALCSTSFTLRKKAKDFIMRHVVGVEPEEHPWSERELFWQSLGVDTEMMKSFERANPVWDPLRKQLKVNKTFLDEQDCIDVLESLFIYGYSWINFSDSRFGKVGPCARKWVLSCVLGIDECFKETLDDPTTSKYYANGYLECDGDVRLWLATAAFSCYPVESMIVDLLEDDRFFARALELKASMDAESIYVSSLPDHVFAHVLDCCGLRLTVAEFKHQVSLSMHISRGYVYMESFQLLEKDPWVLTQGDIPANTRSLKARELPPRERATCQMWHALQCGFSEKTHSRSMRLLKDSMGTVMLGEKGHGVMASCRSKHLLLGSNALIARALARESVVLTAKRKADLHIESCERKLIKLEQGPGRVNAKNMYCSKVCKQAKADNDGENAMSRNAKAVKDHHEGWRSLDMRSRLECASDAALENTRRAVQNQVALESAQAAFQLALRRREDEAAADKGVQNTLNAMRFSDDELSRLAQQFYDPSHFRGTDGAQEWARLTTAPEFPHEDVIVAIEAEEAELAPQSEELPKDWWWHLMVKRRDMFECTAIVFDHDWRKAYFFLLGKMGVGENAAFVEDMRQPLHLPDFEMLAPGEVGNLRMHACFDCSNFHYCLGEDIAYPENARIYLYEGVKFEGTSFQTRRSAVLLEDFLLQYPAPPPQRNRAHNPSGPRVSRDWFRLLQDEFPWLTAEDFPADMARRPSGGAGAPRSSASASGMTLGVDPDEEMAIDVRRRLLERRRLWERDFTDMWFFVRVQGGRWTQKFKGAVADSAVMFARGMVLEWCRVYSMPKQKGFMFSRYTEENANMLAWEWARRCSYFFELWRGRGEDLMYRFTAEELDSYVSEEEFLDWGLGLAPDTYSYAAVGELLATVPRNH